VQFRLLMDFLVSLMELAQKMRTDVVQGLHEQLEARLKASYQKSS
jgi:hypothetical protein